MSDTPRNTSYHLGRLAALFHAVLDEVPGTAFDPSYVDHYYRELCQKPVRGFASVSERLIRYMGQIRQVSRLSFM